MINVLMCVYKSGDVLALSLAQLIAEPAITRILVADGPHQGTISPGLKTESPTVKEVVDSLNSKKIYYEYTNDQANRARKNNKILNHTTKDCEWIMTVDSDEIYHEGDLKKLVSFLKKSPPYDRYRIKTVDPYIDFLHEIRIPDWKPRLYRYFKEAKCPDACRSHQFVFSRNQKIKAGEKQGMAWLDPKVCRIYHLNALRNASNERKRVREADGVVTWKGGNRKFTSEIYEVDIGTLPKCIRNLGRDVL